MKKNIKGITLIALIITIIILLILAGISIATIAGKDGLIIKTKSAKEEYIKSEMKEQLILAIQNLQAEKNGKGTLEDITQELASSSIKGYDIKAKEDKKTNGKIIQMTKENITVKFLVDSNLKVVEINTEQNESEELEAEVSYNFNDNTTEKIKTSELVKLKDITGNNNDAEVENITVNEEKNGIIFDGTSSYSKIDLKQNLEFPVTVELAITAEDANRTQVIFSEPNLGIGILKYESYFYLTVNKSAKGFKIPSDFFDGNIKYITITYINLDTIKMYINGEEITETTSSTDYSSESGKDIYLGRRTKGNYFKGKIYYLRIYNKILSESEITESYINDKGVIENNQNSINRSNLVLEYTVKNNDFNEMKYAIAKKDMSGNNVYAELYDTEINQEENGIKFNGTSSYAKINLKQNLEFPVTVELAITAEDANAWKQVIFSEPNLGIGMLKYESYFYMTINYNTYGFKIPSDFFDGTIKYITITYESLDKIKMYINGEEITEKTTQIVNSSSEPENNIYLGKRSTGNYFKGTFHEFSIYNSIFDQNTIIERYKNKTNQ